MQIENTLENKAFNLLTSTAQKKSTNQKNLFLNLEEPTSFQQYDLML